jgi:hypothetical protein
MRVLNKDAWKNKKYLVFITTYCGLEYFKTWSNDIRNSENIQLVGIDTGNQVAANDFTDFPIYQSSQNVGCSGCWNLAANIGFNLYGVDKIIIGQDDALFNESMVERIWNETSDEWLVGAYDRGFTYALFGITKNFWNTVGVFDENFLFSSYEDNDYIHRTRVLGKNWKSLNYSADLNLSLAGRTLGDNVREINKNYMIEKWGHFEGVYTNPFNNPDILPNECGIHNNLVTVYGNVDRFPSFMEFETLL